MNKLLIKVNIWNIDIKRNFKLIKNDIRKSKIDFT